MPQAFASGFKFGFGAVIWGGGEVGGGVGKLLGETLQYRQHLLGIFLPIGCQMDIAAAFELGQQLGDKGGLDEAAFVVAFFVPWVGEEDVDAV